MQGGVVQGGELPKRLAFDPVIAGDAGEGVRQMLAEARGQDKRRVAEQVIEVFDFVAHLADGDVVEGGDFRDAHAQIVVRHDDGAVGSGEQLGALDDFVTVEAFGVAAAEQAAAFARAAAGRAGGTFGVAVTLGPGQPLA